MSSVLQAAGVGGICGAAASHSPSGAVAASALFLLGDRWSKESFLPQLTASFTD